MSLPKASLRQRSSNFRGWFFGPRNPVCPCLGKGGIIIDIPNSSLYSYVNSYIVIILIILITIIIIIIIVIMSMLWWLLRVIDHSPIPYFGFNEDPALCFGANVTPWGLHSCSESSSRCSAVAAGLGTDSRNAAERCAATRGWAIYDWNAIIRAWHISSYF